MTAFRRIRLPLLAALLLVGLAGFAQADLPPAVVGRIESLVADAMAKQHIPGLSIAVATGNKIELERGFGLADVENDVRVTPETRFRTASIAKALTAVAAMKLVEEGKLDLDAEIHRYLPDFPK
ncbi:MAG TPA: serine hydrolase domain-containing protein, partial [Caulifigura sp.]|nr:serine hydrolase domain-containing protein [Caulifigura sp.]